MEVMGRHWSIMSLCIGPVASASNGPVHICTEASYQTNSGMRYQCDKGLVLALYWPGTACHYCPLTGLVPKLLTTLLQAQYDSFTGEVSSLANSFSTSRLHGILPPFIPKAWFKHKKTSIIIVTLLCTKQEHKINRDDFRSDQSL